MKYINQRQSPRIDIRLHCQVSVRGLCRRNSMVTENISRTGVLLVWPAGPQAGAPPRVGQLVTVDIELPADHGFGPKCIHCQAVVVRVVPSSNDGPRVALSVNYMKFGEFHGNIPALEELRPAAGGWLS